ncbi:MAG: lamin tail domain-containing protein [Phycisphaerales bacterium]
MRALQLSPVLFAALALANAAGGQTTITAWNFNGSTPTLNPPATGAGTLTLVGGTTFSFNTGSPNDSGVPNQAPNTTTYPATGTGSGTAGIEFAVSTLGHESISFSFDQRHSNSSSRFTQVQYSTDGSTFVDAPAGLFEAAGGDTWHFGRTVSFAGLPGVDNNPAFKVRVVTVFDPVSGNYLASRLTSTYAGTGTLRYDQVVISGTAVVPTPPLGSAATAPSAVCAGGASTLTVSAAPGQNPPSTGITVTADLSALGGSPTQALVETTPGTFTVALDIAPGTPAGPKLLPITVRDAENRSSSSSANLAVGDCTFNSAAEVVISAAYGGGGNAAAPFNADFIELHNRTCAAVSVDGWSVQYAAPGATNSFDGTRQVNLSGMIAPGGYLLVGTQRPAQDAMGLPLLNPPDFLAYPANPDDAPVPPQSAGGFGMNASAGRIALCRTTEPLGMNCTAPSVVDFLGYGVQASCFEGVAATGDLSNVLMAFRRDNGCLDSDQSFNDFELAYPIDPRNSTAAPNLCGDCAPTCSVDFNNDGFVEPGDLDEFITAFFSDIEAERAACDFNNDGFIEPGDLDEFITTFFAGC